MAPPRRVHRFAEPGRFAPCERWSRALAFALVAFSEPSVHAREAKSAAPSESTSTAACMKCHGDKGKQDERKAHAARKPSVLSSTWVDASGLARSEHRGMECVDCHVRAFAVTGSEPHPENARRATCQDCHEQNEKKTGGVLFATIAADFAKSVHAKKSEDFRCVQCHDAHTFQLDTTRARVFEHNKVCLHCHESREEFQKVSSKSPPDIAKSHEWLPSAPLHWTKVRCIDCHTGYDPPPGSHLILPKAQAVKRCEACHNENPSQLLRLYGRMRGREVKDIGFLNAFIINDSYVIGATRNWWMDIGALLIMGGTGAGIAAHFGLRMIAWAWRRKNAKGAAKKDGDGGDHGHA